MRKRYPSLSPDLARSLDVCWKEGISANIMIVIVDYYLIPLALFLGASVQEIGLLVAVPHLLGSISQLFAVRVVRAAGSRIAFLIQGGVLQASFLLPMAVLAFSSLQSDVLILTILSTGYRVVGNWIGSAWGSVVGDYLPPHERGGYFGWRSRMMGIAGVATVCLAGVLLHYCEKASRASFGFAALFLIASACRYLCAYCFRFMADVPHDQKGQHDFTFLQFLRRFRESNFVKFVLYVACVTFATQLAAPYFSVFMLRDLGFSYMEYMTVHLAAVISGLVAFPIWGRHADIVGNAKVLKITGALVPWIPLLWFLSGNWYYLVLVETFAGFVWGGFNLCTLNFIFDAVSAPKRVRCLGYFNLICGISIFLGAFLGGFLADQLPPLRGSPLLMLFLLSTLMRGAAYFLLSGKFREIRIGAKKVSSVELFFSVLGIRTLTGRDRDWNILPPTPPDFS